MKRSRYTEEQIIRILKELDTGTPVAELCRKHGMSDATYYTWNSKSGGLGVSEAKRLRALEAENAKLKRLLADAMLDNAALKDPLGKKVTPSGGPRRCAHLPGGFAMNERRACRVVAMDQGHADATSAGGPMTMCCASG